MLLKGNFREFFLFIEDNLLNEDKVELLKNGVRGKVRNLLLINNVRNFNVIANNYSNSPHYFRRLINEV